MGFKKYNNDNEETYDEELERIIYDNATNLVQLKRLTTEFIKEKNINKQNFLDFLAFMIDTLQKKSIEQKKLYDTIEKKKMKHIKLLDNIK